MIQPVLTEKSVRNTKLNKYTFMVNGKATKVDVKNAISNLYGVKVKNINMTKNLRKYRFGRGRKLVQKRPDTKRAVITLKEGENLDMSKLADEKSKKQAKS